jgi:hypothetical protein
LTGFEARRHPLVSFLGFVLLSEDQINIMASIDYTTQPLGLNGNGRRIEVCPTCNRNGEVTHYRDGTSLYVHKGDPIGFGLFAGVLATERCLVHAGGLGARGKDSD